MKSIKSVIDFKLGLYNLADKIAWANVTKVDTLWGIKGRTVNANSLHYRFLRIRGQTGRTDIDAQPTR